METTDIGLASFIYSLGKDVEIRYLDARHCILCFEDCPEIKDWQSGQAKANVLVFINAYREMLRRVKRNVRG